MLVSEFINPVRNRFLLSYFPGGGKKEKKKKKKKEQRKNSFCECVTDDPHGERSNLSEAPVIFCVC